MPARRPLHRPFVPSPQQAAFFRAIQDDYGSIMLEAGAGAGKSTTLLKALPLMGGSVFFGAFNKAIATELKLKAENAGILRSDVRISTFHGAGYGAWIKKCPGVTVDDRKVANLLRQMMKDQPADAELLDKCFVFLTKTISFGKQCLMGLHHKVQDTAKWLEIIKHFDAAEELPDGISPEPMLSHIIDLFVLSHEACPEVVDFDDMIYAPLAYSCRFWQNDWVLIDECQDINPARREMAARMLRPRGRMICVGDEFQAIYGFTGADGDSINKLVEQFRCKRMPLTVTYRCPKDVVAFARQWCDRIEAAPDAPDGLVRPVKFLLPPKAENGDQPDAAPWFAQEVITNGDAILCRYTRPLVQTAYAMIRAGIKCKIEGRDVGNGLITLATKWKTRSIDVLDRRLATFLRAQRAKAKAENKESRADNVTDMVECLRVFMERARTAHGAKATVDHVTDDIRQMFADQVKDMPVLSTGHKAKGREWRRVFWLQTSQRGAPATGWQAQQERNIKYVIATRSMDELVLIPEHLEPKAPAEPVLEAPVAMDPAWNAPAPSAAAPAVLRTGTAVLKLTETLPAVATEEERRLMAAFGIN